MNKAVQSLCDQAAVFLRQGDMAQAEALYGQVLAADPGHATANHLLGVIRSREANHAGALALYDRALAVTPNDAALLFNRANALYALKQFDAAIAGYERALSLRPDIANIRRNLANALHDRAILAWTERRDSEAAISDLENLLRLDPDFDYARGELLHLKMYIADWRGLDAEIAAIRAAIGEGKRVIKPFAWQALSDSPADLQACAVIAANHLFPAQPAFYEGFREAKKKIRIGYVSGEFREQATAYLAAGLYEAHDRDTFEIIAFDSGENDHSPMRARLEAGFDKFVSITYLSDHDAAEKIQAEQIDILVNLNGWFGALRMGVFAQRPAPLQVNFLGFPGTMGAPYMDYIIADKIVIPEDEARFYTEQVAWLPDSYQVNDNKRRIAATTPSRADCGLPEKVFVFCNFNAGYKLTPDIFALWLRLLDQVKGSVLWLQDSNPAFRENILRHAGPAAGRIIFAPRMPADQHLARLKLADLFLDTLPCNAHTTASDALFAGLPLVTCRGNAFSGRVAASLLNAVGLPELVTENLADYEKLATALATDPARLSSFREKLANTTTPLFDTARFTRNLEAAFATMWQRRGEAPKAFSV